MHHESDMQVCSTPSTYLYSLNIHKVDLRVVYHSITCIYLFWHAQCAASTMDIKLLIVLNLNACVFLLLNHRSPADLQLLVVLD